MPALLTLRIALLVSLLAAASPATARTPPDTAASVRWTAAALDLWASAADDRADAAYAASRGDSTGLRALRPLPPAGRLWPLLALAQRDAATHGPAAVAGASAFVLDSLLATDALRARVAARLGDDVGTLADTTGLALGARLARARLTAHPPDDPTWDGHVPADAMGWTPVPGTEPDGAAVPGFRPLALDRADRFRPEPPPAPGTPAFEAALAEVRQATLDRTAAQRRAARFWARHGATEWVRRAVGHLAAAGTPDPAAADVLARLTVSIHDATIACWDAKYRYWLIRPEQADPSIERPFGVGLPNFPAYPAGHACTAGAAEAVLADALPAAAPEVRAAAWEMAESRLWGGVHYRFDNDAGLALGRSVAEFVSARPDRLAPPAAD